MSTIKNPDTELASIRQELDELRHAVAALRGNGHTNGNGSALEANPITDRRGMLKTVAGLAVGVATVGLLRPSSSSAAFHPKFVSPNATGGNMIIGGTNAPTASADDTIIQNPASVIFPLIFLADQWQNNAFSTPANTFISLCGHVDNSGATPTSGSFVGVYGEGRVPDGGTGYGVFGISDTIGVYGEGDNNGCGVDGFVGAGGTTSAFGMRGISSNGLGGSFSGGRGAIGLGTGAGAVANPNAANPSGSGIGDLYRGSANGSLWYKPGGTGSYRRLADDGTAGALTLQAPMRLVDTRTGSGFADAGNHYASDTLRTYNIITLSSPDLPVGTRGVVGRFAVVNASASGGLQASPNGPPGVGNDLGFGTAVITFPPAATLPAFSLPFVSALDATGQIRVHSIMGAGQTCDVIIDITGYYL